MRLSVVGKLRGVTRSPRIRNRQLPQLTHATRLQKIGKLQNIARRPARRQRIDSAAQETPSEIPVLLMAVRRRRAIRGLGRMAWALSPYPWEISTDSRLHEWRAGVVARFGG